MPASGLTAVPFPFDVDATEQTAFSTAGFVAEAWGTQRINSEDATLSVSGNNRLYLCNDVWTAQNFDWPQV